MTSVEVPYSIACALPSLVALDVTNEVAHEVARAGTANGIVYVTAGERALIRVTGRESDFFDSVEDLLARLVPLGDPARERLLSGLLGARSEPVPFADGQLRLGDDQRILLFGFGEGFVPSWTWTVVG
jgi:thiamine phosphate synthase YjbQ (UPF0047 family)